MRRIRNVDVHVVAPLRRRQDGIGICLLAKPEAPEFIAVFFTTANPVDYSELLQSREGLGNRLSAEPRGALQSVVGGVKAARLVVQEIEDQAVQYQQDMAADNPPVTSGEFVSAVPLNSFVIDADCRLLRHGYVARVFGGTAGPDRPCRIAGFAAHFR